MWHLHLRARSLDLDRKITYSWTVMSKRTHQPKKKRRFRVHGFLGRMATRTGRNLIKRRRDKGRKRVSV